MPEGPLTPGSQPVTPTLVAVATRILIVEDDATIGSGLVTALETNGYVVDWATSGRDALTRCASKPPALVLLDLGLPDLDGIEVCRRVRSVAPDATIVILTARHDEIDVVVGLEAGADDYLTKPFDPLELLERVNELLEGGTELHTTPSEAEQQFMYALFRLRPAGE